MSHGDRREFIRMSLAAASASVVAGGTGVAASHAAADAPTKSTYLVIYRPGPAWKAGARLRELPLKEHGRYMLELFKRGALRFGGGFADDSGGAAMFEAQDDVEAHAIVAADPAVTSQIFTFQLHRWALVPWSEIAKRAAATSAAGPAG
ncbi:MAG: YciI family protein [Steroidobacter sp.]